MTVLFVSVDMLALFHFSQGKERKGKEEFLGSREKFINPGVTACEKFNVKSLT